MEINNRDQVDNCSRATKWTLYQNEADIVKGVAWHENVFDSSILLVVMKSSIL